MQSFDGEVNDRLRQIVLGDETLLHKFARAAGDLSVNLVVAVFIWVMIYPMMIQIDWHAVKDVGRKPRGLILTLVVNWLIKPFTMAVLGVLFFQYLFARGITATNLALSVPRAATARDKRLPRHLPPEGVEAVLDWVRRNPRHAQTGSQPSRPGPQSHGRILAFGRPRCNS